MLLAKLKVAGAVLAAAAVVTGLGVYGSCSTGVVAADPPAAATKLEPLDLPKRGGKEVVATIHGDQHLTRDEFADYLIRRYGAEKIKVFVNKAIINAECARRGITVTVAEVEAGFAEDLKTLRMSRDDFVKAYLPKAGKSPLEWTEDVIRPRLQLTKLTRDTVAVSEDDLRKVFENKYGERRQCELTVSGSADWLNPLTKAALGRHGTDDPAGRAVEAALFEIKKVGDRTLVYTDRGRVEVMLVQVIPPDRTKTFEAERVALLAEVTEKKLQKAIPAHFAKLREEAKPTIYLPAKRLPAAK